MLNANYGIWLDGYEQGKAAAEREFQESEDWNDYLAKVITDARADEREHIVGILFGIDSQVAELVKEILDNEQN